MHGLSKPPIRQARDWWDTLDENEKRYWYLIYDYNSYTQASSENGLTDKEIQFIHENYYNAKIKNS